MPKPEPREHNPLPQLVLQRARKTRQLLEQAVWHPGEELVVEVTEPSEEWACLDAAASGAVRFAPIAPGTFYARDTQRTDTWEQVWFRVHVPARAPEAPAGPRFLRWDAEGEATVYIGGVAWWGLDPAHRDCPLPDGACDLLIDGGCWQTAIPSPPPEPVPLRHGLRFDGAATAFRDEACWRALWDFDVWHRLAHDLRARDGLPFGLPWEYSPPLLDVDPLYRRVLRLLDRATAAFRRGGPAALSESVAEDAADLPAEAWQPAATAVGHAHLDLVWQWPERVTHKKAVHTFATMLRLIDEYPRFVFSQSSPAVYRAVAHACPEQRERIARRIGEGRWEATGAMEVESDTLVPHGEALARCVSIAQRAFAGLRGGPSRVCWLPDTFGYSAALPTILSQLGVAGFYTQKLLWSNVNKFPHTSFRWRGLDGGEVLAHLGTVPYVSEAKPKQMRDGARTHLNLETHPELIAPIGWGDGGGGTTAEIIERAERCADMAGVPRTTLGGAEGFFERMCEHRGELPTHQGEIYLEYHRGTATTHSEFKRRYRRAERALQAAEAARAAAGLGPIDEEAWRRVVFAQFHDALPGTSIPRVYRELGAELDTIAESQLDDARRSLGPGDAHLFNPVALPKTVLIERPDGPALVRLPPAGTAPASGVAPRHPVGEASPALLNNGLLRAEFDASGALRRLSARGDRLPMLGDGAGLYLYEDKPHEFQQWDIDHDALLHRRRATAQTPLAVAERSPVRAVLESNAVPIGERSAVTMRYVLEADSDVLGVELLVDWREDDRLLRYELPSDCAGVQARFGCGFGAVSRPQMPGPLTTEAMWECHGSRWAAAVRDDGSGLAIITEAKYGFSCRSGLLGVSLLRSPSEWPDPTADRGRHRIRFALGAYRAKTDGGTLSTAALAEVMHAETIACDAAVPPLVEPSDLAGVVPAWIVPDEAGGWIVRLHDTAGAPSVVTLRSGSPIASAQAVDLSGAATDAHGAAELADETTVRVRMRAYAVCGVRITPR